MDVLSSKLMVRNITSLKFGPKTAPRKLTIGRLARNPAGRKFTRHRIARKAMPRKSKKGGYFCPFLTRNLTRTHLL